MNTNLSLSSVFNENRMIHLMQNTILYSILYEQFVISSLTISSQDRKWFEDVIEMIPQENNLPSMIQETPQTQHHHEDQKEEMKLVAKQFQRLIGKCIQLASQDTSTRRGPAEQ